MFVLAQGWLNHIMENYQKHLTVKIHNLYVYTKFNDFINYYCEFFLATKKISAVQMLATCLM